MQGGWGLLARADLLARRLGGGGEVGQRHPLTAGGARDAGVPAGELPPEPLNDRAGVARRRTVGE